MYPPVIFYILAKELGFVEEYVYWMNQRIIGPAAYSNGSFLKMNNASWCILFALSLFFLEKRFGFGRKFIELINWVMSSLTNLIRSVLAVVKHDATATWLSNANKKAVKLAETTRRAALKNWTNFLGVHGWWDHLFYMCASLYAAKKNPKFIYSKTKRNPVVSTGAGGWACRISPAVPRDSCWLMAPRHVFLH